MLTANSLLKLEHRLKLRTRVSKRIDRNLREEHPDCRIGTVCATGERDFKLILKSRRVSTRVGTPTSLE
jgi:hypothetical protein